MRADRDGVWCRWSCRRQISSVLSERSASANSAPWREGREDTVSDLMKPTRERQEVSETCLDGPTR